MIIYFKDDCAWFAEGHIPEDGDRLLLQTVTEHLPGLPPESVPINSVASWKRVAMFEGCELSSAVEYLKNVQAETPLPMRS